MTLSIVKTTALAAALGTLALTQLAHAGAWELDPAHTTAQFTVRHMMVSNVRGQFAKVAGTIDLDDQSPTRSTVQVNIDAASIDTREPKRDAHLRSPDFFDVQKYPQITFKATKISKSGKDAYNVVGDLTMHGVTKPVTLAVQAPAQSFKNPWGQTVRGFSATGKINRKDWGLNWNKAIEAGGVLVGDEVTLQIDGEMTAKPPASTAAK